MTLLKKKSQRILTIAVPKGRVLKQLLPKLKKAGINTKVLDEESRLLIREDIKAGVRFLLLKPDDVPTYIEYGAADLGIVGRDVLLERGYDLFVPIDLGIGRCRMMVCGPRGGSIPNDLGRAVRVATKFPNIASRYFSSKGLSVEFIYVQGSVELAPLTGLSDVIVDLVETGETLRQNGLEPYELISEISSVIAVNRVGFKLHGERISKLLDAFREK